jgi:hypothetical protein
MTRQVVDMKGRSLSLAAKLSEMTAFCFFFILYSDKQSETIARSVPNFCFEAVKNDRFKTKMFCPFKKINWNFVLTL